MSKSLVAQENHPIAGVDISKYQGTVDFEKVKSAGIRYVLIRATEGITVQDDDFRSNYQRAKSAGLVAGAYHFYETDDDPRAQLKNFTRIAQLRTGDLPPVVDIERLHEQDDSGLVDNLKVFLHGLESHYAAKPIIYSGLHFANKYMTEFGDYPLWLAEYGAAEPTLPRGWSDWTFWQWSQNAKVAGIDGSVDADRYNGSEMSFRGLLIKEHAVN